MSRPDYNLLAVLDVLLAEGSVVRAAEKLRLSPSAMSRALARLRATTGDPLLVRSGRGLTPTPRALELRERVGRLVGDVEAVLRPRADVDLGQVSQTLTVLSSDGFVETFGSAILARVAASAPGIRLRFSLKPDRRGQAIREGAADLETAVVRDDTASDLRTRALFTDRFVGVVRKGHPLASRAVTLADYLRSRHVDVVQHVEADTAGSGPIDSRLAARGLERAIALVVGGFSSALALARSSDLVATVPERHTAALREDMASFALPFEVPETRVAMLWHRRMDVDPGHRWLRGCMRRVCAPD